jgi:Domain of unknown function (DUF5615)
VSLNLYLDDCSNSDLLATLLRRAGHRVARPTDVNVGLEGADDDEHFVYAAANGLTIITKNPSDFQQLHQLDANHSGILAVYQDNNPLRDMSDAEIVKGPFPKWGHAIVRPTCPFWLSEGNRSLATDRNRWTARSCRDAHP